VAVSLAVRPARLALPAVRPPAALLRARDWLGGRRSRAGRIARLTETLTELVRQMTQLPPAAQHAVKPIAVAARNALRSSDVANAFNLIEALQIAILQLSQGTQAAAAPANSDATAPPAAASPPASAPSASQPPASQPQAAAPQEAASNQRSTLQRAQAAWTATRTRVESDLGRLHDTMQAAYRNHPFGGSLEQYFRSTIAPVTRRLDDALANPLQAIAQNADPQRHAALLRAARDGIGACQHLIEHDPIVQRLDANPFVPLSIGRTVSTTLAVLTRTLAQTRPRPDAPNRNR
jgi:hypothetical protein